jgi:hypothetical protein
MGRSTHFLRTPVLLFLIVTGACILCLTRTFDPTSPAAGSPHKVHIAFGFHVNLYHSFRGDTNDENGFGQDIRVIRHTIAELERFNQQGVPVRAVWDFDNLFSLQEILPVHAPDIISDIQRRVREEKDDVILMSYNNGLMSAMTDEEFMTSMRRAMTNEQGSGVQDLFARVAPVVRPQEMMTTPGNFKRYADLGIDAVSLYYSATPFDAFRMFSRALTPAEAHNPVTYHNPATGERMIVLPTYHAGDLVENVSLRHWAERLHRLQDEGKIDRDVLIFINFDADAEFWTGADLPWHLDWLPNTGGLAQLVKSVCDLDFVRFSTVSDYLAGHDPAGTIHFSQDTADGSFNGYNSWAEKAYASDYWTRIERNRRIHRVVRQLLAKDDAQAMSPDLADLLHGSFETRLRALSTTNFGLATPFLTRQREAAMEALLDRLDWYTDQIETGLVDRAKKMIAQGRPHKFPDGQVISVKPFVFMATQAHGDRHLTFKLPVHTPADDGVVIGDVNGRVIPATVITCDRAPDGSFMTMSIHVAKQEPMPDGVYALYRKTADADSPIADTAVYADAHQLKNEFVRVRLDDNGHVTGVTQNGVQQLDAGSLIPYIVYKGRRYPPGHLMVTAEQDGRHGVAAIRLQGPWDGPPGVTRAPGWVDYRLRLLPGNPYLFIDGRIRYPDTRRDTVIQAEKPMLARKIDAGWQEVAPVELRFSHHAVRENPFIVHKRNFLGIEDAFAVDYFRHAPENVNVADINNQITAEYVGVAAQGHGMAVAMNNAVSANFAFSPLKLTHLPAGDSFAIRANPFGTYHGPQVVPPTRGNRLGYEAVILSAPQLHSAGPTYNGYQDRFELMVAFFDGDTIPKSVKQDLIAYARRPAIITSDPMQRPRVAAAASLPPAGFLALPDEAGVVFHWDDQAGPDVRYRIDCRPQDGSATTTYPATGHTLRVDATDLSGSGERFGATIQAVYPDGRISEPSPEINFTRTTTDEHGLKIPNEFKMKILWANVAAWVQRNL